MTTNSETARDLHIALIAADEQLAAVLNRIHTDCITAGMNPYAARTPDGGYLLAPLLAARANVLAALVHLDYEPFDPANIGRTP